MKIAIAGAAGRMGQMLIREIARTDGCSLTAALESPGSNALGTDAGGGVKIVSDAAAAIGAANAVIDFTVPAATVAHAGIAADKGTSMVIGTTGLNPEQTAAIHDYAKRVPILWAANMSMGINILLALVEKTAAMLDPAYDIEVLEMHHRHKIDAPSGTALALGRAAAAGRRDRLRHPARRRGGGRPHSDVRRRRRAAGDQPSLVQPRNLRLGRSARGVVAAGQEARPLRHEGRAGALIPVVRVAGRAHVGQGRLQLLGDFMAFGGCQEAADHDSIAARDQHQPVQVLA